MFHGFVASVLCILLHRFIGSLIHGFIDWEIERLNDSSVHPSRIALLQ